MILLMKFIALAMSTILGIFVVPIAILLAKDGRLPKWAWIWGNDRDGIEGDGGFKNEHCPRYRLKYGSFLCKYIWLAIRNSSANLCWYLGVNEEIVGVKQYWWGNIATGKSGLQYYQLHIKNSLGEIYAGYKNNNARIGEIVPYNIGVAIRGYYLVIAIVVVIGATISIV